jgi:hypothetical protein
VAALKYFGNAPEAQALFFRRRHQPRRPPAKIRPGRTFYAGKARPTRLRCLKQSVLAVEGQHACRRQCGGNLKDDELTATSDDELTTPSRQGQKTTAGQDQAGQASTDDGTGHD